MVYGHFVLMASLSVKPKTFANKYITHLLSRPEFSGFDGEITVGTLIIVLVTYCAEIPQR